MEQGFNTYCFEYQHDGARWALEISATSEEDAWQRLQTVGNFGKFVGVAVCRIPARLGLIARAACWLRNLASVRAGAL